MFLCCFSLKAGRKDLTNRPKQHRNIFSNHTGRLAKFGWILTYFKISVEKISVHVDWAQTRPSLSSAPTQSVLRSIEAPDDAHGSTWDQPRVQSQTNARPLPRFPSDGSHSLPIDVIHLPVTSFTCQWRLHFQWRCAPQVVSRRSPGLAWSRSQPFTVPFSRRVRLCLWIFSFRYLSPRRPPPRGNFRRMLTLAVTAERAAAVVARLYSCLLFLLLLLFSAELSSSTSPVRITG